MVVKAKDGGGKYGERWMDSRSALEQSQEGLMD